MELTAPSAALLDRWRNDWAARDNHLQPDRLAGFAELHTLAVVDDGEPVGMVAVADSAGVAESFVLDVWTVPQRRGAGVGRRAVSLIEDRTRHRNRTTLRVRVLPSLPAGMAMFDDYRPTARHMELPVGDAPDLPPDLTVEPLPAAAFPQWRHDAIDGFARQSAASLRTDETAQRRQAEHIFDTMLPNGVDSPGHEILRLCHHGTVVAELWLRVEYDDHVFILNVASRPRFRGRGYGRAAMRLAEARAAQLGRTTVRLNVFANNTVAYNLYQDLGYRVTDEHRVKEL